MCLVASKGNYFELAWAIKEKLDKELDQLLKPYTGIWLSLGSLWEPGLVSSQLALCLSSLLFSVHLLFSSLLWSPWQKQGLLAALKRPDMSPAIEKNVNIPFCPHFNLVLVWHWLLSGKVPVTTNYGQKCGVIFNKTPFRHHHLFIGSFNNHWLTAYCVPGTFWVPERWQWIRQEGLWSRGGTLVYEDRLFKRSSIDRESAGNHSLVQLCKAVWKAWCKPL